MAAQLPISNFFAEVLGAPLANTRWSWGALNPELDALILRVWEDEAKDGTILVLKVGQHLARHGQKERTRHIEQLRDGRRGLGVLCRKRGETVPRVIDHYDDRELVEFGTPSLHADGNWYAPVRGRIAVTDLHRRSISVGAVPADIDEIEARALGPTATKRLIDARIGQGRFRTELLALWDNRCAVSGCTVLPAIRASHAKPWRQSTDAERLDPCNGLPLLATLDALFDDGLIGFDADGTMLVSPHLTHSQRAELGLSGNLRRRPSKRCAAYLAAHATMIFRA